MVTQGRHDCGPTLHDVLALDALVDQDLLICPRCGSPVRREDGEPAACVSVGPGQELRYRETRDPIPDYDGHHIAIYVADFSGPHQRLLTRGLVSEESDQHQYRFVDLVDLTTGKAVFALEHEVRSMRHPLYARPLVNRNPAQTNRTYAPGHDDVGWAPAEPAAISATTAPISESPPAIFKPPKT